MYDAARIRQGGLRPPPHASPGVAGLKVARNNLFHGDKGHNRQRDTDLMRAALFVLNSAYEAAETHPNFQRLIFEMEYGL
jgi:hypothetical protein